MGEDCVVHPTPDRFAAAVIRAWVESGDEGALKIRITTSGDMHGAGETLGVASDVDVACSIVRAWLEGFAWAGPASTREREPAADLN